MKLKLFIIEAGPLSRALSFVLSAHVMEKIEDANVVIVHSEEDLRRARPQASSGQKFMLVAREKPKDLPEGVVWMDEVGPLSVFISYLQAMNGASESWRSLQEE